MSTGTPIERNGRAGRGLAFTALLAVLCQAGHAAADVYLHFSADGVPVYSNLPPDPGAAPLLRDGPGRTPRASPAVTGLFPDDSPVETETPASPVGIAPDGPEAGGTAGPGKSFMRHD
jgi:hypothetical protein